MWLDLLIWYFMFFSMLKGDGTLFCYVLQNPEVYNAKATLDIAKSKGGAPVQELFLAFPHSRRSISFSFEF